MTSSTPTNPSPVLTGDVARFSAAWSEHEIQHADGHCERVFDALTARYQGDSRHYHDRRHIIHCLSKLDESTASFASTGRRDEALVELAIWFHDAVYIAGDRDNELRSADWFRELAEGHLAPASIARINSLISATKHHEMPDGDLESLMVDIDLSSFSLDQEEFMADGRNIRQEFDQVSDAEFVAGQSRFLQALLDRPSIYSTRYFLDNYEDIARENIRYLLARYNEGFSPTLD